MKGVTPSQAASGRAARPGNRPSLFEPASAAVGGDGSGERILAGLAGQPRARRRNRGLLTAALVMLALGVAALIAVQFEWWAESTPSVVVAERTTAAPAPKPAPVAAVAEAAVQLPAAPQAAPAVIENLAAAESSASAPATVPVPEPLAQLTSPAAPRTAANIETKPASKIGPAKRTAKSTSPKPAHDEPATADADVAIIEALIAHTARPSAAPKASTDDGGADNPATRTGD